MLELLHGQTFASGVSRGRSITFLPGAMTGAAFFRNDADRKHFLELIAEAARRWSVRVHAYVMLDNHYHLLIETGDGFLSAPIRYLNGVYTQHYNRRHKAVGHLFHGRFKALIVDRESYLLTLSRYIHQNPINAKMVSSPENYRWSSCRAFLAMEKAPPWLEIKDTLEQFGGSQAEQVQGYARFLASRDEKDPLQDAAGQLVLGSDAFLDDIKKRIATLKKGSREHSQRKELALRVPKEVVIQSACKIFKISPKELFGARWSHSMVKPVVMRYLRDCSRLTLEEIARLFGVGYGAVHLRVKRLADVETNDDLKNKIGELERLIGQM